MCKKDLLNTYFVPGMPAGADGDSMLRNAAFMAAIRKELTDKFAELLSNAQITGDNYNAGLAGCDTFSLFDKLNAEASVIEVSTPVNITAANVQAELQRALTLYPARLRYRNGDANYQPKFAVSPDVASAWQDYLSQSAPGWSAFDPTVGGAVRPFQGIEMYVINEMPDSTFFLTYPRNIKMFGNTTPGATEYIERDLSQYDINDTIRIAIRTKTAVDFGRGDEIVTYNI
jgi:hypothetical protein